ncbi:MAG: hypothetical protein GY798_02990 [Hyphomicrobiales bacterium]|nr:hypothetical protein [Hyphomicrobiales bacterium]
MLRAIKRVLEPGGRMGFHLIHPASGLSDKERAWVHRIGPPAASLRGLTLREMTERAGFVDHAERDVTAEYLVTLRAKVAAEALVTDELERLYGPEEYSQTMQNRRHSLDAIEAGHLRRSLVVCRAP